MVEETTGVQEEGQTSEATQSEEKPADDVQQKVEQPENEEPSSEEPTDDKGVPLKNRVAEQKRKLERELHQLEEQRKSAQQPESDGEASENEQEAAIDKIADSVYSKIAPSLSVLKRQEMDIAISQVAERPYAGELANEIVNSFKQTDTKLPYSQRIDMAYKDALAGNIEKLTSKAEDTGYIKANEKISEKQSASAQPAKSGIKKSTEKKFDLQRMTPAEKEAKWAEILSTYDGE